MSSPSRAKGSALPKIAAGPTRVRAPSNRKPSKRWRAAYPAWSQWRYLREARNVDDLAAMRLYLARARAGIVARVRAELPGDLVRLIDTKRWEVHCHPNELRHFDGGEWFAEAFVPFKHCDEFARQCGGRLLTWWNGCEIIGGRLFGVFVMSARRQAPQPWQSVWSSRN
ncbi:MAG: hypothetical protein KGL43_24840 [Burkholderiales bacterium]|nr:hypothetical protein [Burkholderiales bacterium]MDE2395461.1 hypothetical protein [Burkholderiales bacterium]MDE2456829.1 hypothetical protein [Burkholderiales bacterium]